MTPKQKVTIRLYRPSDCAAVQNLFKTCIVYGAQSPCRMSVIRGLQSPSALCAYALLLFSLLLGPRLQFCNLSAGLLFFGSLAYLGVLLHGRAALYVNFAYSSVKADLSRVVDHYELKYSAKEDGYTTTGPKGFWVAELVPPHNDGNAEIVGYVALDVSSRYEFGTGEMRRMVVSPNHRRLGIASVLFTACETHAREQKLSSIVLQTTECQPQARNLYEKYGYRVVVEDLWPSGLFKIRVFTYKKYL